VSWGSIAGIGFSHLLCGDAATPIHADDEGQELGFDFLAKPHRGRVRRGVLFCTLSAQVAPGQLHAKSGCWRTPATGEKSAADQRDTAHLGADLGSENGILSELRKWAPTVVSNPTHRGGYELFTQSIRASISFAPEPFTRSSHPRARRTLLKTMRISSD
jgi:hypothetical protein